MFYCDFTLPAGTQTSEQEVNTLTASNLRPSTSYLRNTPESISRRTRSYDFSRSTKRVWTFLSYFQDFSKISWKGKIWTVARLITEDSLKCKDVYCSCFSLHFFYKFVFFLFYWAYSRCFAKYWSFGLIRCIALIYQVRCWATRKSIIVSHRNVSEMVHPQRNGMMLQQKCFAGFTCFHRQAVKHYTLRLDCICYFLLQHLVTNNLEWLHKAHQCLLIRLKVRKTNMYLLCNLDIREISLHTSIAVQMQMW